MSGWSCIKCKLYRFGTRSSWSEQLFHKFIDVLGDALLGERLADAIALAPQQLDQTPIDIVAWIDPPPSPQFQLDLSDLLNQISRLFELPCSAADCSEIRVTGRRLRKSPAKPPSPPPTPPTPTPAAAPSVSPEFMQARGRRPNYCTGVPDAPMGINIGEPCRRHDECYAPGSGISREQCDVRLGLDIYNACRQQGGDQGACFALAETYYIGVRVWGAPFYHMPRFWRRINRQ